METAVGINWDGWRQQYSEMTFRDQQAFYRQVAQEHPDQQHFDVLEAEAAFSRIGIYGMTVVEMGGWDGALAETLIGHFPIVRWQNYDIVAVYPQVCDDPRYKRIVLGDWFWNQPRSADVFVATHTIEHITGGELAKLFDCLDCEYVYLESPLKADGQSWAGYVGSHILELGWRQVDGLLVERGYELIRPGVGTGLWQSA